MRKILLFLTICLFTGKIFASNLDRIVFFGDSLTDDGKLYQYLFHVLPKSPPYFQGRFSNGPTWAETVGKYYYDKEYIAFNNYAIGGATAVFHPISKRFISPATLEVEIHKYLLESMLKNKSNTLYSIWIGGNDYLFHADKDVVTLTNKIVNKTIWAMEHLHKHGARYFLILNLPDLGKVPEAIRNGDDYILSIMTNFHNQKLHEALVAFRKNNPDSKVIEVDIYSLYEEVVKNPGEINKKYNVNIGNLKDSCWGGGLLFSKHVNAYDLKNDINHAIDQSDTKTSDVDVDAIMELITTNPALSYTYRLGKSLNYGAIPCRNPDNYLYWDSMHPTAIVHSILAKVVIEALAKEPIV